MYASDNYAHTDYCGICGRPEHWGCNGDAHDYFAIDNVPNKETTMTNIPIAPGIAINAVVPRAETTSAPSVVEVDAAAALIDLPGRTGSGRRQWVPWATLRAAAAQDDAALAATYAQILAAARKLAAKAQLSGWRTLIGTRDDGEIATPIERGTPSPERWDLMQTDEGRAKIRVEIASELRSDWRRGDDWHPPQFVGKPWIELLDPDQVYNHKAVR